jgi:hypothetical protein
MPGGACGLVDPGGGRHHSGYGFSKSLRTIYTHSGYLTRLKKWLSMLQTKEIIRIGAGGRTRAIHALFSNSLYEIFRTKASNSVTPRMNWC